MLEKENFRFVGLLKDKIANEKEKTFNGIIEFKDNSIYVEKKSRLNGSLKDSFEVSSEYIDEENIDRLGFNRIKFIVLDHTITLKSIDEEMIDEFELNLRNLINNISSPVANSDNFDNNIDSADLIRKYYELFQDGIITKAEFENKKKQLLE